MVPFLKWAGGKRWFVAEHAELLRRDAHRYVDPFLGGGAVFFHVKPARAILSDLNGDLIETYQALRDEPREVWKNLRSHQRQHSKEHYYLVRQQRLRNSARRAARFIYLNRTCFNGLYRVNRDGAFNVPKGTRDSVLLLTDDFETTAGILRSAFLTTRDFAETISECTEGDFLYVDPPYTVRHNKNSFLRYNEDIFSWSDQKRLADSLLRAAKQGACVLMTNANHTCIHNLYMDRIWQRLTVGRLSLLASSANNRNATTELVVSNYLNRQGRQVDSRN